MKKEERQAKQKNTTHKTKEIRTRTPPLN